MSTKEESTPSISSGSVGKKKRKVVGLEEKLAIIDKYESGITKAKISREHAIGESTVRNIIQNSKIYKEKGQSAALSSTFQTTRNRSSTMIEMERLLSIWIEDCNQKNIPLNTTAIKKKAVSLFGAVQRKRKEEKKTEVETNETFFGSSGWLVRFRKRSKMHNLGTVGASACSDDSAAIRHPAEFKQLIKDTGCGDQDESMSQMKEFSINEIDAILKYFEEGKQMIMGSDPNVERAMLVSKQIEKALSCYRALHKEKRLKQTSLLQYLKK